MPEPEVAQEQVQVLVRALTLVLWGSTLRHHKPM